MTITIEETTKDGQLLAFLIRTNALRVHRGKGEGSAKATEYAEIGRRIIQIAAEQGLYKAPIEPIA